MAGLGHLEITLTGFSLLSLGSFNQLEFSFTHYSPSVKVCSEARELFFRCWR